jgi:hypothetical protein
MTHPFDDPRKCIRCGSRASFAAHWCRTCAEEHPDAWHHEPCGRIFVDCDVFLRHANTGECP